MTIVAYRDGVLASDSRVTVESTDAGTRCFNSVQKLFRKDSSIIATVGESSPGIVFVRWYGSARRRPKVLLDPELDWTCLVLDKEGLWEWDSSMEPELVAEPFYAIGAGTKAALGAMHMGASAEEAVRITCLIDPFCGGPIQVMRLEASG